MRLLPVENASTDGAEASPAADGDAGVPEDAANEEPWAAGIRAHLERRGWTQGELAARSSLKPNTVGAVLRGDPTSTRTLTAIAAGFGVGGRGAIRRRGPRAGRPLDRGAGAPRRGGPDAGRGEGRRDPAPRADPGRGGRRRAGGPGGAPGAGGDRRGRGGSPGRAGAVRVRPGRGTRRIPWVGERTRRPRRTLIGARDTGVTLDSRFRRYTPRMLRTLDIEASLAAEPLLEAVDVQCSDGTAPADRLPAADFRSGVLRTQSDDHRPLDLRSASATAGADSSVFRVSPSSWAGAWRKTRRAARSPTHWHRQPSRGRERGHGIVTCVGTGEDFEAEPIRYVERQPPAKNTDRGRLWGSNGATPR